MGVEHRSVERRDEQIEIRKHNGHGAVDDAFGAVDKALGLVRVSSGVGCEGQWGVSDWTVSLSNHTIR